MYIVEEYIKKGVPEKKKINICDFREKESVT